MANATGPKSGLHWHTAPILPVTMFCTASFSPSIEQMMTSLPGTLPAASTAVIAPNAISSLWA